MMKFCEHCGIAHPPMNGLLSYEIVKGFEVFKYRGLTYEIWYIHHPLHGKGSIDHWWCWARPIDKAKEIIDICYKNRFIEEYHTYYIPSYSYRESFLTQERAIKDAKENLIGHIDWLVDNMFKFNNESLKKKIKNLKLINAMLGNISGKNVDVI